MSGHPMISSLAPPSPSTTVTTKPNSYDDQSISDLDFGSEVAASAKIDNFYRIPAPQNILNNYRSKSDSSYQMLTHANHMGKSAYTKIVERYLTTSEVPADLDYYDTEVPLTGPMVVRVYPDGTPVKENVPLPQDEDLRLYKLSKVKLPSY